VTVFNKEIDSMSLQFIESTDKICKSEDELWEKGKYVTALRNQLSSQSLHTKQDMRQQVVNKSKHSRESA
jgi:hypothetical protein